MSSIADTIRRFQAAPRGGVPGRNIAPSDRLERLSPFGTNPGGLNGWFHAPEGDAAVPLVVVLHGCTQTAAGYDHGSGWSALAERFGFAVLFPEQQRANNANGCFNWFSAEDIARDRGEASSIRQMIAAVSARRPIDAGRVFVTGLSAGGAMANVMLATYPEVFAGGSIIAGLPYGEASSVGEALGRMRGAGLATASVAAERVRRASSHQGRWPRVTVWHGDADHTVNIANADAIVGQWRTLHGADASPDRVERVDGQELRIWLGTDGAPAVEEYRIAGLGHGTPLKTQGPDRCGNAGAFMLEAGISSTWLQAQSWGLLNGAMAAGEPSPERISSRLSPLPMPRPTPRPTPPPVSTIAADVNATIAQALRSAGLLK